MRLLEGIPHIEDLDLQSFLKTVTEISKLHASEKLDGAQLWFGLDKEGKLYTSRAGKTKKAENFYQESDYPYFAANNGFRSALAALKSKEDKIKNVIRPGDTVEIEVLFGRQPNAVTYGASGRNYIAFLRGVNGTQDILVDQLAQTLSGDTATVKVKVVDTTDGENLDLKNTDITYEFVGAQKIDTAKLKDVDVNKLVGDLQKFLEADAGLQGQKISNFDLVTSSLAQFGKELRPAAKVTKTVALAKIMTDFKLPIKKELLDRFVKDTKSNLTTTDVTSDEDIGIEGVVLRNPENGEQVKLVDKDTFTTINQFNYATRNEISGLIRTTDGNASLEARGGLVGKLKITIADLLGNKDLARGAPAKKVFATLKGADPEETVRNVAKQMSGGDDYLGTKRKVLALIDQTQIELSEALKEFKANKDQFRLKLKTGKIIGLSAEVIRRTLLQFAETKRNLKELYDKIKPTKTLAQLVALLYGHHARAVHEVEEPEDAKLSEAKLWRVKLEPSLSSKEEEGDMMEHRILTVLGSVAIGGQKALKVVDFTEKGGTVFEFVSDDTIGEGTIWDRLGDAEIDWCGKVDLLQKNLKEELLTEKRGTTDKAQYIGKDGWTLFNIYFATYAMAAVIYHEDDKPGIRMLRDKSHMHLTRWDKEMSPLNFWGYPIWRCGTPAVGKLITKKVASEMFKFTRKVPPGRWKLLHIDMSFGREVPVEWEEHRKTFNILQQYAGLNIDRINNILDGALAYPGMTFDEKVKYHAKLFYYVQQFVPSSPLATRLRYLYNGMLLNATGKNDLMVENMKLIQQVTALAEDGEAAAAAPVGPAQTATSTNADAVANFATTIMGKNIVRRKRNPAIQRLKFPRPKDGEKA